MKDRARSSSALLLIVVLLLALFMVSSLAEGTSKPISAKIVIDKIKTGAPVEYHNCIINGDLSISSLPQNMTNITSGINITHCTINGSIKFPKMTFQKTVNFEDTKFRDGVEFTSSTFSGSADFKDAQFNGTVNFVSSKFNGPAIFNWAIFYGAADFSESTFNQKADFSFASSSKTLNIKHAIFNKDANFEKFNYSEIARFDGTYFGRNANFKRSHFFSESNFKDVKFVGETCFANSQFERDAEFKSANFSKRVSFRGAKFNGTARFTAAKFYDIADFVSSVFNGDLYFNGKSVFIRDAGFLNSEFNGLTSFEGAKFCFIADFTNAKFNELATFSNASFKDNTSFMGNLYKKKADYCYANFSGESCSFNDSDFKDDVLFEETNFAGKVYLLKTKYNKMYIRWKSLNGRICYDDAAYLSLIENFKSLGYVEDTDNCYYAYRKERRNQEWDLETTSGKLLGGVDEDFRKSIDWLLEKLYGYGVDPLRPFYYSLIVIILFTLGWWWIGNHKQQSHISDFNKKDTNSLKMIVDYIVKSISTIKDPFIFSLKVFLAGTRFFIDPPEIPKDLANSTRWANRMFFLERVLGALLFGLLFLAVSRTIIR